MSYNVLYRQFRPKTFSEVSGQDSIVKVLQNQIKTSRIGHAYLFCGSKGTGKTTIARIFAKTINCLSPIGAEACGKCAYCMNPMASEMDIIEIDGASNRGIDEIRELTDKVYYMPTASTYKVYIIDEVHMLTTEAFNALLKTLEEPPKHVVFIFATTSKEKIPPTILSRTQRFDFARISERLLVQRMRHILSQLNVPWDEGALGIIASASEGSFRDALSILDKCLSITDGRLKEKDVLEATGMVSDANIFIIASSIAKGDGAMAVRSLRELYDDGKEISLILSQLCTFFTDVLILPKTGENKKGENYMGYISALKAVKEEALVNYIEALGTLQNEYRYVSNIKSIVEAKIVYLSHIYNTCDSSPETVSIIRTPGNKEEESTFEEPPLFSEEPSTDALAETQPILQKDLSDRESFFTREEEPVFSGFDETDFTEENRDDVVISTYEDDKIIDDTKGSLPLKEILPEIEDDFEKSKEDIKDSTETFEYESPLSTLQQEIPLPQKDIKEVMREIKIYVRNTVKDPLVATSIDTAIIGGFDGDTVTIVPTVAMARMADRFIAKGGVDILTAQFRERVSKNIKVIYKTTQESPTAENLLDMAKKSFGDLEEF